MKLTFPKNWCEKAGRNENGCAISVGRPDDPMRHHVEQPFFERMLENR